jgi:hypothetical protein
MWYMTLYNVMHVDTNTAVSYLLNLILNIDQEHYHNIILHIY